MPDRGEIFTRYWRAFRSGTLDAKDSVAQISPHQIADGDPYQELRPAALPKMICTAWLSRLSTPEGQAEMEARYASLKRTAGRFQVEDYPSPVEACLQDCDDIERRYATSGDNLPGGAAVRGIYKARMMALAGNIASCWQRRARLRRRRIAAVCWIPLVLAGVYTGVLVGIYCGRAELSPMSVWQQLLPAVATVLLIIMCVPDGIRSHDDGNQMLWQNKALISVTRRNQTQATSDGDNYDAAAFDLGKDLLRAVEDIEDEACLCHDKASAPDSAANIRAAVRWLFEDAKATRHYNALCSRLERMVIEGTEIDAQFHAFYYRIGEGWRISRQWWLGLMFVTIPPIAGGLALCCGVCDPRPLTLAGLASGFLAVMAAIVYAADRVAFYDSWMQTTFPLEQIFTGSLPEDGPSGGSRHQTHEAMEACLKDSDRRTVLRSMARDERRSWRPGL